MREPIDTLQRFLQQVRPGAASATECLLEQVPRTSVSGLPQDCSLAEIVLLPDDFFYFSRYSAAIGAALVVVAGIARCRSGATPPLIDGRRTPRAVKEPRRV
jgi:hypothetical protein